MVIGIAPVQVQAIGVQQGLDDLPLEKLENPTEVSQLLENFSGLEFRIREYKSEDLVHETEIKYQLVGKEEIQGIQADKVTLRGKGIDPVDVWLDEGNIVQFEVNGERVPAQMADMLKESMFQAMFFPFYYVNQMNLRTLEDHMVGQLSRSREMIGTTEVDVVTIEVEKFYNVDIEEFEFESGILRIAEFEDFLMVAGYEIKTVNNEGFKFEVEMVELR
ncbi:MAG TPA: hypothetical protein VJ958_00375 [Atribacterota bacterium]|nr:hypothetical protein [Atribacterota bacterium]